MLGQNESRRLRPFSDAFAAFTAGYCHPQSRHYQSAEVLEKMEEILDKFMVAQHPDGTMDSGGNRMSPPDTAFYLEKMCPAASVLRKTGISETGEVQRKLDQFLLQAGQAIRTGGIHTPNHRWVVASVLAHLFTLYEDERYLQRMEEWLADGIYINEDGNYPERSRNYSIVENNGFVTIGRLLNRPELFDIARKNLETNYYYMEPNGELLALDSRRQDQNFTLPITRFYFLYRYLAHHYKDDFLAGVVQEMEGFDGFEQNVLSRLLVFMEEPVLLESLASPSPPPTTYVKELPGSSLVRIRRGDTTASIFGGNDKPLVVASGRSVNPTFFTFRKGEAVLESVRLSTSFFNTGYVRPDGVQRQGNQYFLSEQKEAYYYHPMPADKQNAAGDYQLSPSLDNRFWSKLDFENRPKDTVHLDSRITITENQGTFQMDIQVDGPANTPVIVEFRFKQSGTLTGVVQGPSEDDYFLEGELARYAVGNDTIEIGPGIVEHENLRGLDGEVYSSHFGTLKRSGKHVYLTGLLPFKHAITLR